MKYAKIEINKERSAAGTHFIYPPDYDPACVDVVCYQNTGADVEFAIALIPDDCPYSDGIIEIDEATAETLIDTYVDTDKDIKDGGGETASERKTRSKRNRKNRARERKGQAETVAQARERNTSPGSVRKRERRV